MHSSTAEYCSINSSSGTSSVESRRGLSYLSNNITSFYFSFFLVLYQLCRLLRQGGTEKRSPPPTWHGNNHALIAGHTINTRSSSGKQPQISLLLILIPLPLTLATSIPTKTTSSSSTTTTTTTGHQQASCLRKTTMVSNAPLKLWPRVVCLDSTSEPCSPSYTPICPRRTA